MLPAGSRSIAALAVSALVVSLTLVPRPVPTEAGPRWAHPEANGGRAIVHRVEGKRIRNGRSPARAVVYDTGFDSAEPTLGIDRKGTVFYAAADIDGDLPNQVDVIRTTNEGRTWDNVSPALGPAKIHAVTLDPYVWMDEYTGRIYTIDLTVACAIMSFSDNRGQTWTSNPLACGRPVNDHHTLFGGPPAISPTAGYDSVLYYCWNDIATSSCGKSLNGGLTWTPTGVPAFAGVSAGEQGSGGFCGGLHGHGVVGADGTVFLPREYCNKPFVAISGDEGATWETVQVANTNHSGGSDPSVAVDRKGNVYYTWVGPRRKMYLTYSRDGGETWSRPLDVTAPGVTEANLSTMDAGKPGRVAIAYYGSENSPGKPFPNDGYAEVTWNGYVTVSGNVFAKNPTFHSASLNHRRNPLVRGRCGPGRCKAVFDFIDVEIAPDGTAWVALTDDCTEDPVSPDTPQFNCVAQSIEGSGDRGLVGRLIGGPRLR